MPTPAELATPWRRLVNPFRMRDLAVVVDKDIAYAPEHGKRGLLDVYRPATGADGARAGAAPGPRRRLDHRQQGPAGHPADAAPRRQGLGLRGHQLPPGAPRPVPGPDHRREARHRLDPRAHRGVRRRPGLHRHHRRLGGRSPRVAGRRHSRTTRPTSPASRTPTPASRSPCPHYGVYDFAGSTGPAQRRADARPVPRAEGGRRPGPRTRRSSRPAPRCSGSPRRRRTSSSCTAPTTRWSRSSRPASSSTGSARPPSATVVYAELPGAQHAFDVFPSIRSAHVVRAIDRYLHWHWNSWRRQQAAAAIV